MNHKLYKIKTKTKIQQKIPLQNGNSHVSTETQRQTVTPNKDVVGEERERLN